MSTKVLERGNADPTVANAYTNTVADYGSANPPGDNVIEDAVCDSTVAVGDIVRMSGTTVVKALANSFTNSKVIGICIAKPTSTTCDLQTCGHTSDIYGGLSTSDTFFLSDSTLGATTTTPPTSSGSYVIRIGRSQNGQNIVIQLERVAKRA